MGFEQLQLKIAATEKQNHKKNISQSWLKCALKNQHQREDKGYNRAPEISPQGN